MSLRSSLTSRLSIAAAASVLAVAAAVTPAVADDDWGAGGDQSAGNDWNSGGDGNNDWNSGGNGNTGGNGDHHHDPRTTRGVVTANTLALRSAPNRGSQIIRFAHRGDVVHIFCKWEGERVQGDPTWYLLTDGTWAWGSGRFIDPIDRKPRRC
ncbi:SH3 domain-containing protein [Streptomyces tuirus]|uniref:SH3 domain-containing protein n=1 Tax=Streptomyces tuirus TaxID=68278 RepID=A0A941FFA5_9ACTN|nr:SH3 domain-containing protein [Streptomyces tuirus]